MLHILEHSILDCIKLIPFWFVTYLIMEYIEHKTSDKSKEYMRKVGKAGPVIGGLLGAFPQCGFSVSVTNLYVGRVVSVGTLIAVYLSTSDEMIPVFLAQSVPASVIFKAVGIKVVIGMIAGILVDFVWRKKEEEKTEISHMCEHDKCHCHEDGILKSTIMHTVKIAIYVLIINLILNTTIEIIGEETISNLILNKPVLGPVLSGLVGLIPNCASSVIIAELYVGEMISAGTMIAGLLVGSGVGILVLLKENNNLKESLKIISVLYAIGVGCGIILETVGLVL